MDIKKIEVADIYPIIDKGYIIVHLKETKWINCQYEEMKLWVGNEEYIVKYAGFGNMNGILIIKLFPLCKEDIFKIDKCKMYRKAILEVKIL